MGVATPREVMLTERSKQRLRKVAKLAAAEPQALNMGLAVVPSVACGSAGCLFGWALHVYGALDYGRPMLGAPPAEVFVLGADILGLEKPNLRGPIAPPQAGQATAAERLFYPSLWPEQFTPAPVDKRTPVSVLTSNAQKLIARVEHFIATDGKE